jgi:hypothetical protein
VGWLSGSSGHLFFPNFDKNNGRTAKKRAEGNRRVAKHRQGKADDGNAQSVTSSLPKALPEKRREEKNRKEPDGSCRIASDAPPSLDPVWDAFPERGRRRSSRKKLHDAWKRIPAKERPSVQTLLDAIAAWKATEDWRKQDGEFVPALDRWIRDRKWADPPEPIAKQPEGDFLGGRKASITKASDLADNDNLNLEPLDEFTH